MAAASTDKARKSYSFLQKTLGATIGSGDTSLTLNNYTNIPTDTAVDFIIDRIDSNGNRTNSSRELCKGVCTGSAITNVTRGLHGTTAQSHDGGAIVEFVASGAAWNDLIDLVLVEHNQDGTHSAINATSVNTGSLVVTGTNEPGRIGDVLTFTASGTWTKDPNLKFIEVEVQGAGGGGGGSGSTDVRIGAGGGAGGYGYKKILASSLSSTETVTIGVAGSAGTTTTNGGNGGNSSFGTHVTANGGSGGTQGGSDTSIDGGAGGTATGGDINITGQSGGGGGTLDGNGSVNRNGFGGFSKLGIGGVRSSGSNAPGGAGTGYGAGGAGGSRNGASGITGGAGTAGLVIVREYY